MTRCPVRSIASVESQTPDGYSPASFDVSSEQVYSASQAAAVHDAVSQTATQPPQEQTR